MRIKNLKYETTMGEERMKKGTNKVAQLLHYFD